MGDEAAVAASQLGGEAGGDDERRRGGEDGVRRGGGVEFGEQVALYLQAFGAAFLHELRAGDGVFEGGGDGEPLGGGSGVLGEAVAGDVVQRFGDQLRGGGERGARQGPTAARPSRRGRTRWPRRGR